MTTASRLFWLSCLALVFACGGDKEDDPDEGCQAPQEFCAGKCRDFDSDPLHCGACAQPCATTESCEAGACVPQCGAGELFCDGACVDSTSDEHCGACGKACGEGEHCDDGTCVEGCGAEKLLCGGACVDPTSDDDHCGDCDVSCKEDETCIAGVCEPWQVDPCKDGEKLCGDTCVDTSSSAAHCGDCYEFCDDGMSCVDGACVCLGDNKVCDEKCVDPASDDEHCGDCGNTCFGRENASAGGRCVDGACELDCDEGFEDCDGEVETGCETHVAKDAENCSACGVTCYRANVTGAECVDSGCYILECDEGWEDCDGDWLNGCETEVLENPTQCGACDNDCTNLPHVVGGVCSGGVCQPTTCAAGWEDCDGDWSNGCEVSVESMDTDTQHCGGCNIACDAGMYCSEGACRIDYEIATWPLPPDGPTDYIDNGDTVTDNVTGLVWQKVVAPETMSWEDAVAYCESDPLGDGKDDWRLPSAMALRTLVDQTRTSPALNIDVFDGGTEPTSPNDFFWTRSESANFPAQTWRLMASTGMSSTANRTNEHFVRCVRGGKWVPGERYELTEETVTDRKTGLMWQRTLDASVSKDLDYADAETVCSDLALGGFSNWRIPTVKELESIIDRRESSPAVDLEIFPDTPANTFWSSTLYPIGAGTYWTIGFGAGNLNPMGEHAGMMQGVWVRCVRDGGLGGALRSVAQHALASLSGGGEARVGEGPEDRLGGVVAE